MSIVHIKNKSITAFDFSGYALSMSGTIELHFEGLWYKYITEDVFGFKANVFYVTRRPLFFHSGTLKTENIFKVITIQNSPLCHAVEPRFWGF